MCNKVLFGKYAIEKVLGRGGTSIVYLAKHIMMNQERAIKCVSKHNIVYDDLVKEIAILKNLNHPSIPMIYDVEQDEENVYIIEEYIRGESLKSYRSNYFPIQENVILTMGIQISSLIGYLHTTNPKILYLDFKPENIIVHDNQFHIIDFGSCIPMDYLKNKPTIMGTKGYAAPELYGGMLIDERSDIYGIGMLLFYMMFGTDGVRHENMSVLLSNSWYSKDLKHIVTTCLRHDAGRRYQSVQILNRKLRNLQNKNCKRCRPMGSTNQDKGVSDTTRKSYTIAIIGSQSRIGVTHLAILINSYLCKQKKNSIYVECNHSNHVLECTRWAKEIKKQDTRYLIHGYSMLPYECKDQVDEMGYTYIIKDMGTCIMEQKSEFLSADLSIVVLGVKEWEQNASNHIIKQMEEWKDRKKILYAYNFIDDYRLHKLYKTNKNRWSIRIPYETNPFEAENEESNQRFMQEILQWCKKE